MRGSLAVLLLLATIVAACGGQKPDTAAVPTVATPGDGSEPTSSLPRADSSDTTVPQPLEPVEQGPAVLPVEGATPLLLLTESGGGTRPNFEWEPVTGADTYVVVVFTEDGRPYWSGWTGETTLPMGGAVLDAAAPGPRIDEGYRWTVYALDADDLVVTSSELRVISP
jgi:hypothetical protein